MRALRILLMVLGAGLVVAALLFDPTVAGGFNRYGGGIELPDRVANLPRLQAQTMMFQGGLAAAIAGVIAFGFGELLARLEKSGVIEADVAPLPSDRPVSCGWCDQTLVPGLVPCSRVSRSKLEAIAASIATETCRAKIAAHGIGAVQDG